MPKTDYEYPEVDAPEYTKEELEYRGFVIQRLEDARDKRDQEHAEFDDMSYVDYWETNARAGHSYIEPKKNAEDVRIVTGTTKEKVDTFVSALLNYNLEPNIMAYNRENREVRDLGENMEAMVKKSRDVEMPDYEVKKVLIYQEGAIQGDCFVEDVLVEYAEIGKKLTGDKWDDAIKLKKVWSNDDTRVHREIQSNIIAGLNFYPGNVKDFYMASQPYVFTREIKTYEECKQLYGDWTRWGNVAARVNPLSSHVGEGDVQFHDWSLEENEEGFVEVIKYYDKPRNEFMLILNGVMMLPIGFPLEALLGVTEYPMVKFSLFPISRHFFYSKGISSKTKVDQAMIDEFYKMFIVKTRKSVKPPHANNTGRHLTERIFMPGRITNDIDPNRLGEIGDNKGVTQSEFNMLSYIKKTIDEKSVSPVFQGESPEGEQTATEVVELKKQSLQKLGLAVYGVINFEKSLAWLRLHNIVQHWTKVEDTKVDKVKGGIKNIYKRIEMDDSFNDGTRGTRVIQFTEEPMDGQRIKAAEDAVLGTTGRKVRIVQLKPEELRNARLNWEIIVSPTPKDSDALEKAQFNESMVQGMQLFPQAMNMDYWREQWALKGNLDPDKAFVNPQQQQMAQQQMMQQQMAAQGQLTGQGQTINNKLNQAVRGRTPTAGSQQRPTVNSMVRR